MKTLSISNFNLPERPGYGTLGQQIVLRANYFHLLPKPDKEVFRYTVGIDPDELGTRKKRRIFTLLMEAGPIRAIGDGVATDYSSTVVTSKKLDLGDDGRKEIPLDYYEKEDIQPGPSSQRYTIKLQYNGNVAIPELLDYLDSTPANQSSNWDAKQKTIQALNMIMTRIPNTTDNVVPASGNKFYPYPASFQTRRDKNGKLLLENSLGGGLFALKGYYSSVRTSTLRVLVNVNVCTSAFYPAIPLLDLFLFHLSRLAHVDHGEYAKLEPFIKKLRVSTNHVKKDSAIVTQVKTIQGFPHCPRCPANFGTAKEVKFVPEPGLPGVAPGEEITVESYYRKSNLPENVCCDCVSLHYIAEYNKQLQHPDLALIIVKVVKDSTTYLPVELCHVMPGQLYKKKLNEEQTAQMIGHAAKPPKENAVQIMEKGLDVVGISGNRRNHVHVGCNVLGVDCMTNMLEGRVRSESRAEDDYSQWKDLASAQSTVQEHTECGP